MSEPREAVRSAGAALIAAERERQVEREGWTPEHDDSHAGGQLWRAAECYLTEDYMRLPPHRWPWIGQWWKPSRDRVRNLVKAGALIAAEIDRLQRAARRAHAPEDEVDDDLSTVCICGYEKRFHNADGTAHIMGSEEPCYFAALPAPTSKRGCDD